MAHFGLNPKTLPVRITAHGSNVDGGRGDYPDNMSVSYQFADDKVLLYEERSWTPYGQYGVDSGNAFYGTEGSWCSHAAASSRFILAKRKRRDPA